MKFRGKVIGTGRAIGNGAFILIRPYAIGQIPTTPEALSRIFRDAGLYGRKVRITIEEE